MSFDTGIQTTNSILALAPSLLQIILLIEQLVKAPKAGPAKKALALSVVPPEMHAAAGQFIDDAVAAANLSSPSSTSNSSEPTPITGNSVSGTTIINQPPMVVTSTSGATTISTPMGFWNKFRK